MYVKTFLVDSKHLNNIPAPRRNIWQAFLIGTTCSGPWGVWDNPLVSEGKSIQFWTSDIVISDQNRLDVCVQNVIVSHQNVCSEMTFVLRKGVGGGGIFLWLFEASPLVVNTIFVKCVLVFYGRELTFRGSAIVHFCILRDPKKNTPLKKLATCLNGEVPDRPPAKTKILEPNYAARMS